LFIQVAVPVPGLDLLTYAVPDGVATPKIGARVVVPLGTRVVTGIVVEVDAAPPAGREAPNADAGTASAGRRTPNVKAIREVLDPGAFVPPEVVALARQRVEARAAHNFEESDRLRAEIEAAGWDIRDEADGFRLVRHR